MAKGREPPPWYYEEPALQAGDVFYIKAFAELTTCRSTGMGVGPISWEVIVKYGAFHGLDSELIQPFIDIIMGLDALYLERQENKSNNNSKPKKPGAK